MDRAVFVDKDGTLVKNVPYNIDPAKMEFYPDVIIGLRKLQDAGYKIIIVTNQPGVALGYFSIYDIENLGHALSGILFEHNVLLDGFYYCPHLETGIVKEYSQKCDCRKPLPGMMETAARKLKIDLCRSWMIGDILHDVESGNRAGCRTVLIDNGNETEWILNEIRRPDFVVKNFGDAVNKVVDNIQVRKFGKKGAWYEGADEKSGREIREIKSSGDR